MARYLITGANRGIGLALTTLASQNKHEVVAVCRSSSSQLDALGVNVKNGVDVTSESNINELVSTLAKPQLDVVILNAGILTRESLSDLNADRIRKQMEINAIAPLMMTSALLPTLSKGSKVILMTSRMGSIDDNTSGGMYGYRMSKAALNMVGRSLSHDLRAQGIAVALIHPGFVRTEMTGNNGNATPEESAAQIWERIQQLTIENSGTFWHANGEVLPW
jgi:NAD(P)-dependent dehydrogenase (short-subunit alcohol dehydrogenase family)